MGQPTPNTAELKRRIIAELELARADLFKETRRAQVDWNPVTLAQRSLQKHKVLWLIGGAVTGLILVRLVFPPKIRSDKSGGSDRKRGFSGIFGGLLFKAARTAAFNYATKHFKDQAETYLHSMLNRQAPERPSHVANR
jgi:hypothetical protein